MRRLFWVALLGLAAGVRVWHLGTQSLWLDEAQFLQAATQPSLEQLVGFMREQDFHPPLYPLLLRAWVRVMGQSDVAVRALPLLCGLLLIPATFRLALQVTQRRAAALGAACVVALNSYHVYLSQEGRHYTWLALLGCVHMESFLRLLKGSSLRWWAVFWCSAVAGLLSHYHMALILLAELAWSAKERLKEFWAPIASSFLVFALLWAQPLLRQVERRAQWGEGFLDPGLDAVGILRVAWQNAVWVATDFSVGNHIRLLGSRGLDPLDLVKAGVAVGVVGCLVRGVRVLHTQDSLAPVAFLLAVPLAGAMASGLLQANVFETKYVSFAACLWAVVLGAGMSGGWAWPVVLGLGLAVGHYHLEAMPWKEEWKRVAGVLAREWRPGDVLLQRAPYTTYCLDHYLPFRPPRVSRGLERFPGNELAQTVGEEAAAVGAHRLWVVLSHDEAALDVESMLDAAFPLVHRQAVVGIRLSLYRLVP